MVLQESGSRFGFRAMHLALALSCRCAYTGKTRTIKFDWAARWTTALTHTCIHRRLHVILVNGYTKRSHTGQAQDSGLVLVSR